jgi:biopolymer transport protein ExbB
MERVFEFLNEGGPVNWVIAGLYALMLAVVSERAVYFFRTRYNRERGFEALKSGPLPAGGPSSGGDGQPARMARVLLEHRGETPAVLSEMLDREAALIKREMERGLGVLSFIAAVAPLLGLLGTITGLMNAFGQIEARGTAVDISFLSGGIREAMITTATGLVTAICALACCKRFEYMAEARLGDMSFAVSILGERLMREAGVEADGEKSPGKAAPEARKRGRESA